MDPRVRPIPPPGGWCGQRDSGGGYYWNDRDGYRQTPYACSTQFPCGDNAGDLLSICHTCAKKIGLEW